MLPTYQAILRSNQVEWIADRPDHIPPGQAVRVYVTLVDQPTAEAVPGQGSRMAAALEKLANRPSPEGMSDPVGWERETREDRPLPGRED
jgi:hypothetical protein